MTPDGSRTPRAGEWVAATAAALVLIGVMTWPTVPGFLSYGRIDSGDGRFSIWNIGWIDHALLTSPSRLLDANIFHPHTGTLAYSELNLVAGVFGLPAFALTGNAIAATNGAIIIGLLCAFLATWLLVHRLTGSHAGGLVAATGVTFCPYVQAHTAHIQLLMIFGVPLVLVAFHRFLERPSPGRGAMLGVSLTIAGLACAYYGIFAGIAIGVLALALARSRRSYWIGLVIAMGVASALTAPVFIPYLAARRAVGAAGVTSLEALRQWSATIASYRSSPSNLHESLHGILAPAPESLFPGFLMLALAAMGFLHVVRSGTREERRTVAAYVTLAVIATWASFGPDAGLYRVFAAIVPPMSLLRTPSRLGVVTIAALAVPAGFGARALARRWSWAAFALVPLMALELASLPWPIVAADRDVPEAYRILAAAPRGPVVEFPFMYKRAEFPGHTRYMFNSTYHWQPLVNGYSDVIPQDFVDMAAPINAFPDADSFALIHRLGVKYVVWHLEPPPSGYDPVSRDKILARIAAHASSLKLLTKDRGVYLYEITGWPE